MAILGSDLFTHYCTQYASLALLYYDWSLTLTDEIELIWRRKIRYVTVLYCLCRYAMLSNLLYLLYMSKFISKKVRWTCRYTKFFFVAAIFGRLAILLIWTIRTWAVWHKSKWILVILGPLLLLTVVFDCIEQQWEGGSIAVAMSTFTVEVVSTALMAYQCLRSAVVPVSGEEETKRPFRVGQVFKMPQGIIYRAILHDGIGYCIVVSLFVLVGAILHYPAADVAAQDYFFAGFSLPVSGMLTARFILHIRSISDVDMVSGPIDGNGEVAVGAPVSMASIQFRNHADEASVDHV